LLLPRDHLPIRDGFGYPDILEDIIDMPATGPDPGGIDPDMTVDLDMTKVLDIIPVRITRTEG
jgi:hypothetical protein